MSSRPCAGIYAPHMQYYVYILTNHSKKPFYTGVSNNLAKRIWEHKNNLGSDSAYTKKYKLYSLVYYEIHGDITGAIAREKSIKRWTREKKISAIEGMNPEWRDMYFELNS